MPDSAVLSTASAEHASAEHATSKAEGWLQVTPLLADLRAGNLVGNLEALTRSAAEAAEDIHRLQSEVRCTGRRADTGM